MLNQFLDSINFIFLMPRIRIVEILLETEVLQRIEQLLILADTNYIYASINLMYMQFNLSMHISELRLVYFLSWNTVQ